MKEQIIAKSASLFLKLGFKTATMDDIAALVGISKKTLYQFFDAKEELVSCCIEHISNQADQIISRIQKEKRNPIEELYLIKNSVKELMSAEQQSSCMYQLSKYYPDLFEEFQVNKIAHVESKLTENLMRGQELGLYRTEIDTQLYSKFYFLGVIGAKNHQIFQSVSADIVKDEFLYFFLRGICTQKGIQILNNTNFNINEPIALHLH